MADAPGGFAVLRQPGNGANGPGYEQEPVRKPVILPVEQLRQKCGNGNPERLSFAKDGWQAWHEIRTSSVERPGK